MDDHISLHDGEAKAMGDGVFLIRQDTTEGVQDVVLTKADLEALLAAC